METIDIIANGLLAFGFCLKVIGFLVRDEMWLRITVASGLGCDALFYGLRTEPVWQSVGFNVVLVTVNIVLILVILTERTTWRMSAADRALYRHFATLSPGQFRRIKRIMQRTEEAPGAVLIEEAAEVRDLILVLSETVTITKAGQSFPISGPTFVGEIAFLTGEASSAAVTLPEGGTVIRLPIAELKQRMERSPPLNNAMVALFGAELAKKTAYSVPIRGPSTATDAGQELRPSQ